MNMIIIFRSKQRKKRGCLVISIHTHNVCLTVSYDHNLTSIQCDKGWKQSATSTAVCCLCVWLDEGLLVNAISEDTRVWAWVWNERSWGLVSSFLYNHSALTPASPAVTQHTINSFGLLHFLSLSLWLLNQSQRGQRKSVLLWSVRLIQRRKMLCSSFIGADLSITLNQIPMPGLVLVISLV